LGGKAIARSFDITDEASDKELVEVTVKEFGRLDGLFDVAARLSPATLAQDSDVLSVSVEVWRHTIDVTLSGYMSASATRCPS
jgi:NAD(P)-dependent dehydrogenase (short-subunit alcohol dehydrogenase family)